MMIISKFNRRIIYVLFAGTIISLVNSLFFLQIFAALLTFMWLLERYSEKKKSFDIIHLFFIIYLLARAASIVFSEYPMISRESLLKEIFFYLSFFSMTFYFKSFDEEYLDKILIVFFWASIFTSIAGLIRYDFGWVKRAESFSSGYSVFSSYLLCCFTFFLFYKKNIPVYLRVAALSLMMTAMVTSQGRTNILLGAAFLIFATIIKKTSIRDTAIIVGLTIVLSFISFQFNPGEINERVKNPMGLSDRDIIYKGAKELAFKHPVLGYGTRTFKEIFPYRDQFGDSKIDSWHNDILTVYFEMGTVGLIAFFLIVGGPLLMLYKFIKNNKEKNIKTESAFAVICAILALFLSSLTAGFITSVVLSLVFSFLLSVAAFIMYKCRYLEKITYL